MAKYPCFHGFINAKHAETLLYSRNNGFYLVRCSTNSSKALTISWKEDGNISHFRVANVGGVYKCTYNGFSIVAGTLDDLVSKLGAAGMELNIELRDSSPFVRIVEIAKINSKYPNDLQDSRYVE